MTDEELIKLWTEDIKEQHSQDATYLSPGVYVREIDYSPEIPPFEIEERTRRLMARWTIEAPQDLASMHNIDPEDPEITITREENENGTISYNASCGDLRFRRTFSPRAFVDGWDIESQVRDDVLRAIRARRDRARRDRAYFERQRMAQGFRSLPLG
jgi:hypothetical protein